MPRKSVKRVDPRPAPHTTTGTTPVAAQPPRELGSHLSIVPISEILDDAESRLRLTPLKDWFDRESQRAVLSHLARLRPFWHDLRVGDIRPWGEKKGTIDRYVLTRTKHGRGEDDDGFSKVVSVQTALNELATLRRVINKYKAEHGLIGDVEWKMPKGTHAPVDWFERDEVARLLWALRGRVWDQATNAWAIDAENRRIIQKGRPVGLRRRRWDESRNRWIDTPEIEDGEPNRRAWIGRWILFLIYTGSTSYCATRVRWSSEGDASYVDLDNELEGRSGHLYRLGPDLASRAMAGVPVALSRRLTSHLRRWREADKLHGFKYIIHPSASDQWNKASPDSLFQLNHIALREIAEQAGFTGESMISRLSCTAVVWVLRSGMRAVAGQAHFQPAPAIMRSAALMIGRDYKTFRERFQCVMPDFLKRQVDALSSLPDVVK